MHSYLHTSISFLNGYSGGQPMAIALKSFFRGDRKYGSRDRKWISELCYARMRTVSMFNHLDLADSILASFLLTQQDWHSVVGDIFSKSNWEVNEGLIRVGTIEKLQWLQVNKQLSVTGPAFPLSDQLSDLVDVKEFQNSLLRQPLVWLRCRKDRMQEVMTKLSGLDIQFELSNNVPYAIGVNQRVKLDDTDILEKGLAEIQDLSSQKTLNAVSPKAGERWYDACAASGGKSLLLLSKEPDVQLTVSDVRPSILENLHLRLKRNKVDRYESFVADLSSSAIPERYNNFFDGIIADVPCSGSGTWGRTPEQMFFFSEEKLQQYAQLQQSILKNIVTALKPGGKLVYITCSVYRAENEAQVDFLKNTIGLTCLHAGLIEGSRDKADTLFVAVLEK